jgi:hypothetical protein
MMAQLSKTEPYMTKSLSSEQIKSVLASTTGGNISITGVDKSEAKIEVYLAPNGSTKDITKEELEKRLNDKYTLSITVTNNKLIAKAEQKEKITDWKKAVNVSFKIYVPGNISTDLSTSGGNINLVNLSGDLDFSTSGGNLNLAKVSGKIDGKTSGGNIYVENAKDNIELTTSGGNIYAKNCDGTLRFTTSGGNLTLSDLKGDIKASTSGGNVTGNDVVGKLSTHTSGGSLTLNGMSCNLDASTSGGNIHVEMKELQEYVTIGNDAGHVDVIVPSGKGLDLKLRGDKIKTDKMDNFSGKVEEDEVTGKLNGGGTAVTIKGGSRVYLGFNKN